MTNRTQETLYHALAMAQLLSKCDLQEGLVYILLELEMESYQIGYHYVKNAILLFYRNPVHMVMTGIYQVLIEQFGSCVTYKQIEQAMRAAIGQAHRDCDLQTWGYYFRNNGDRKGKRPKNYVFVSHVAAFLELWQACCKEVSYEI